MFNMITLMSIGGKTMAVLLLLGMLYNALEYCSDDLEHCYEDTENTENTEAYHDTYAKQN